MLIKSLVIRWKELKEIEDNAKNERHHIEADIWTELKDQLKDDGTTSFMLDELKLSIGNTYSIKVDQEKAQHNPSLFKVKYDITYSQYKKDERKTLLDSMVTITPSKPSFRVEVKNDNN